MASAFACYDNQDSGKFWISRMHMYPIMSIAEDSGLYSGDLFIRRDANVLKKRHFVGNENHLYYLKVRTRQSSADRRVLKYTSINWKVLDSFEEVSSRQTLFGFRLSGATDHFEFYTKDEAALVYWLDHLGKFAINTDLREDYQLISEISRGLRATVYKAKELLTGQKVAVKLVPKTSAVTDSAYLASMHREVTLLRSLKHPNIVALHRLYEDDKNIALIQTYAGGLDLSKHILKSGMLDEGLIKKLAKGLLELLAYLRANSVIHNALSPPNIILHNLEDVTSFKLCDFGTATSSPREYNQDLVSLASVLTTALTGKFAMQTTSARAERQSEAFQSFLAKLSLKTEFLEASELLDHHWLLEHPRPAVQERGPSAEVTPQLKQSLLLLKKSMQPEDLKRYLELANIELTLEEINEWSDEGELEEDVIPNRPNVMSVSSNAI